MAQGPPMTMKMDSHVDLLSDQVGGMRRGGARR